MVVEAGPKPGTASLAAAGMLEPSLHKRKDPTIHADEVRLLDAGQAHVVASDAHDMRWRPPDLVEARARIAALQA